MKLKNMKNYHFTLSLVLILSLINLRYELKAGDVFSKSFYSVRPTYQSSMPEKVSFFRPTLLDKCLEDTGNNLQIAAYGGATTKKGSLELAKYFLPQTATDGFIIIKESDPSNSDYQLSLSDLNQDKTVEARHLNIETMNKNFESRVHIRPKQEFSGIGLTYRKRLWKDYAGWTKGWLELSAPIVHTKNNMHLCEEIINDGGSVAKNNDNSIAIGLDDSPRVANATKAFKQKNWKYGKILSNCTIEDWSLADIEFKFGWNHIRTNCCWMNSYLGLVIPTSKKPEAHYVFEPLSGNNNHFGFMFGGGTYYTWLQKERQTITVNIDTNYRYLFSNCQTRSFDLIGKPWGRYMEVYANKEEAQRALDLSTVDPVQASRIGTSGINVFTLYTQVTPQFCTDINTGLQYLYQGSCYKFMVEGGYNFWSSQAEKLEIKDNYNLNAALKGLEGSGNFTLARTIEDNFSGSNYDINNFDYEALTVKDLDLESASQPAGLASILYLTIGIEWNEECPKFASIGGSWEGAANNTIMERWTAWAKFGTTF